MLKKLAFLISMVCFCVTQYTAQVKKLDQAEFKSEILDQWWSFSNPESKQDCDMRIFVVKANGLELNCINWAEGFTGNKCTYDLALTDNFFEIKSKVCQNNQSAGYIYGYLSETSHLFILLRKTRLAVSAALLSEKDWIKFEKIKR